MRIGVVTAWILLALGSSAHAQVRPRAGTGDQHFQTVDYREDQVTLVELAPGYQVTIELAPDEKVDNLALGDSTAWQASANREGNRLFVKLMQLGASTNMTLVTNAREYSFELVPLPIATPTMPYSIRFLYLKGISPAAAGPTRIEGRYHLTGSRPLRPSAISDDGSRTYMQWPGDVSLPAVYGLDADGHEMLVNGNMRDDTYVIDSVPGRLVFRIDKRVARAERRLPRDER